MHVKVKFKVVECENYNLYWNHAHTNNCKCIKCIIDD